MVAAASAAWQIQIQLEFVPAVGTHPALAAAAAIHTLMAAAAASSSICSEPANCQLLDVQDRHMGFNIYRGGVSGISYIQISEIPRDSLGFSHRLWVNLDRHTVEPRIERKMSS